MPIFDDLAGVIDDFRVPGGLTVERRESEYNPLTGRSELAPVTQVLVDPILVHPLKENQAKLLPTGASVSTSILVFTTQPLRTYGEGVGIEADILLYLNRRWVLHSAGDWDITTGHWRCVGVRE